QWELGDGSTGGDPPDLAGRSIEKPQGPIRSSGDRADPAVGGVGRGQWELGDGSTGGDPPNLLRAFCEPEGVVWSHHDVKGCAGDGELGEHSTGGEAPDAGDVKVKVASREPQVAVRPSHDSPRRTRRPCWDRELADAPAGGD